MCPFCLSTTLALVVAGTVSTGGLAALAVRVSRNKNRTPESNSTIANEGRKQNVNPHGR
jgi:hypothetical protein